MTEYKPTNHLRFVMKDKTSKDGQLGWTERVLQQLWEELEFIQRYAREVPTGKTEWRDVECVSEET